MDDNYGGAAILMLWQKKGRKKKDIFTLAGRRALTAPV